LGDDDLDNMLEEAAGTPVERDAWMQAPSALAVDYVQRKKDVPKPKNTTALQKDYQLRLHKNELNQQLSNLQAKGGISDDEVDGRSELEEREVDYVFGDAGASWRMTKLKGLYREAQQSGRDVNEVALARYGNLRDFDDAREEEVELDRRKMYGKGYLGKEKPSGDLYQQRLTTNAENPDIAPPEIFTRVEEQRDSMDIALDQTALNKLKAELMKAKLRKAPNTAVLEANYNKALSAASRKEPEVVVLNAMENRMLVGRKGEVNKIDNKRGRERGLVTENEDMGIDDMIRQERRTKGNGEGKAFAESIAKDAKFDVSPIYARSISLAN
jgi:hypothetical protein